MNQSLLLLLNSKIRHYLVNINASWRTQDDQRLMLQPENHSQHLEQFSPLRLCSRTSACQFQNTSVSDADATMTQYQTGIIKLIRSSDERVEKPATPNKICHMGKWSARFHVHKGQANGLFWETAQRCLRNLVSNMWGLVKKKVFYLHFEPTNH